MKPWTRLALLALLWPSLNACTEKKDLSPPPLNPHPREAIHIRVDFDHPEDAKRYSVTMRALYQNQQRECMDFDRFRYGGGFMYPNGTFDIPNESHEPEHADFTVYLDRYNRDTCNWELASPDIDIHDNDTGRVAWGGWGLRKDLAPGTAYKAICQFKADDFPQSCYGRLPIPDLPHYSRIPITIRVSEDSAPPRPPAPGFFSHFVQPVDPVDARSPSSTRRND
jgi:hypothetical protein